MGMNASAVNLYSPLGNQDQFFAIWKLSRVIKSTGWTYRASTDGTGASGNKETAGAFLQDMWGPGGIVSGHIQLGSQTGAAAVISSVTNNQVTITGLTGMTSNSVGHALTLSGATNAVNNGTFTIVSFVSSSSVIIFNANPGVVEATSLTWSERVSGSASITWSSISAAREQTITGLSGMTTSSAAHYLYLTGAVNSSNNGVFQILKRVSTTSVIIINPTGVSETASGNWTELDPLLDVYPTTTLTSSGVGGGWTVYQGPSTLKIPISAASTGNFIKGENITQSGSNAQGEIIGYQFDTPTATGYLVVMPRQDGPGSIHGWSTSASTITGSSSGATVPTANGSTPVEYVREIVLGKNGTINAGGTVWYQVVDGYGESTSRFTSLLSATGCTNVIPPGGGGTNNGFPTIGTMAIKGGGGGASGTNLFTTGQLVLGRTSVFAANASYTTNVSADGTWTAIIGSPGAGGANQGDSFVGLGFWRVDNNEDGDVDPYVWYVPGAAINYGQNRINGVSGPAGQDHFSMNFTSTNTILFGWRRRGFSTGDSFQQFQLATIGLALSGGGPLLLFASAVDSKPDLIATSILTNPVETRVRDPIWVVSTQTSVTIGGQPAGKMRKGTLRWGFYVSGFVSGDMFDGKKWVQLSNAAGPMVLGPWDGSSSLYCS